MSAEGRKPAPEDEAVLETARLRLRRLDARDADFVLRLVNDPDWLRYIGDRGVRTAADAEHYIETGPVAMYARHGFGLFAVERRAAPGAIGICGLLRRDILPDVDIGFAFLPEFRGAGYAVESAAAVLAWARTVVGVPRVVAITAPGNRRSQALLAKIGLAFEKTIRLPGEAEDVALFGISWTAEG